MLPNYFEIDKLFRKEASMPSAAEIHGMLCGFIAAGHNMDGKTWIEPILSAISSKSQTQSEEAKRLLIELYAHSCDQLQSFSFDFELLLPEDEATLEERSEALGHWCQGFIIGLNRAGLNIERLPEGEAKEAISSFIEISNLDYGTIQATEEDEMAYSEVMEYVRMAVIMIHCELSGNAKGGFASNNHRKLH